VNVSIPGVETFSGEATLGFMVNNLQQPFCLGYIDEVANEWKCQTSSLVFTSNNFVEGNTSHFTAFALIADPDMESENNPPKSSFLTDPILAGIVVAAAAFVAIIVAIILLVYRHQQSRLDGKMETLY